MTEPKAKVKRSEGTSEASEPKAKVKRSEASEASKGTSEASEAKVKQSEASEVKVKEGEIEIEEARPHLFQDLINQVNNLSNEVEKLKIEKSINKFLVQSLLAHLGKTTKIREPRTKTKSKKLNNPEVKKNKDAYELPSMNDFLTVHQSIFPRMVNWIETKASLFSACMEFFQEYYINPKIRLCDTARKKIERFDGTKWVILPLTHLADNLTQIFRDLALEALNHEIEIMNDAFKHLSKDNPKKEQIYSRIRNLKNWGSILDPTRYGEEFQAPITFDKLFRPAKVKQEIITLLNQKR